MQRRLAARIAQITAERDMAAIFPAGAIVPNCWTAPIVRPIRLRRGKSGCNFRVPAAIGFGAGFRPAISWPIARPTTFRKRPPRSSPPAPSSIAERNLLMRYAGLIVMLVTLSAGAGCGSTKHLQSCHSGAGQPCGCETCLCGNGGGGWLSRFSRHKCQTCDQCGGYGDYRTGVNAGHSAPPAHERCGLFERLWGGGEPRCRHCGGRGCHLCRGRGGAGGPGGPGGPGDGSNLGLGPAPAPPPSAAAVGYPYYTNRGPRDFLLNNPPSIGPY